MTWVRAGCRTPCRKWLRIPPVGGGRIDLRAVPSAEPGMSPMEIWCNEAQERYVLAVDRRIGCRRSRRSRERERSPVRGDRRHRRHRGGCVVHDPLFGNNPVDMPIDVLLGKPPRMTRDVKSVGHAGQGARSVARRLRARRCIACCDSRPSPDKTFLITIGDRSVGGLISRDQMVGPWQVPVSDVAVTGRGLHR